MSRIIAIHSFRGGTGKSNMAANVATLLAAERRRVGVVDTDIQSPGLHILFGVDEGTLPHSLNDYLRDECTIQEAAPDVTPILNANHENANLEGRVFLIRSSMELGDITHVMQEGYDVGKLNEGLRNLIGELKLDALLLDTHPGLNQETLLSIAMSDMLAIVMRPDQQDYMGTSITLAVAQHLQRESSMVLVVNNTPRGWPLGDVGANVQRTLGCEVAAVLPHSDEVMKLSSKGIFALHHPGHPVTGLYQQIATRLMA